MSQAHIMNTDTVRVEINGNFFDVPSTYICPLTLEVMVYPMVTRSGLYFERAAILRWLEKGMGTCPLTRTPLMPSDLIRDRRLEAQIRFWRENNNIEIREEERESFEHDFVGFLIAKSDKEQPKNENRRHSITETHRTTENNGRSRNRLRALRGKKILTAPLA